MKKTLRMTAGELISLSVVAVVVGAIIVALLLNNCSGANQHYEHEKAVCDSVTTAIEKQISNSDSCVTTIKRKHNKSASSNSKAKAQRTPKQRNYLDEPANE